MNPNDYCRDHAAPRGSSLYYSLLALPVASRQALMALHALRREVGRLPLESSDASVAQRKWMWWKQEIDRLFAGCPQHPISRALHVPVEQYQLSQAHFHELLEGVEMDMNYDAYPTFNELTLYAHRLGSVVGLLAVEITGYEDRQTVQFAHELGLGLELLRLLRQTRTAALQGRFYIPEDELQRFGVNHVDLLQRRTTDALRELFQYQATRIRTTIQRAFTKLPEVDRYRQRSYVILAELGLTLLKEMEADEWKLLERQVKITPLRKLWITWRIQRRERQRFRHHQRMGQNRLT